jgi:hypothetical protein
MEKRHMRSHVARRNRGRRSGVAPIVAIATIIASGNTCLAQNTGDEPRRFELRIENGRLSDNAGTVSVRRDDAVELTWSADRRSVVHLHGYDIEVTVDAGKPQTMAFRARATGRFPIEMHGDRHTVLIYLEVHPR